MSDNITNQCAGCQQNLPVRYTEDRTPIHYGPDKLPYCVCTSGRYTITPVKSTT